MEKVAPRGGEREGAGRHQEFDGVYQLRYKAKDRKAWERRAKALEMVLADWIRETLNREASGLSLHVHRPPEA